MFNIGVVTGTRAEYGLLKRLLVRIKESDICNLNLFVTGTHLEEQFGNTAKEIVDDGFLEYYEVRADISGDKDIDIAKVTGRLVTEFADAFSSKKCDIVVVLGDRYEIIAAAEAAFMLKIPIAHISGGDITEGALDDTIRHCITKMSILHFTGCEQSRKRVIQMGEQPNNVFNVGEPGVENAIKMNYLTRNELADNLHFDGINKKYGLVTFHPVTLENSTAELQVRELIKAMDSFDISYVITLANADAGGRVINDIWLKEAKNHHNWFVTASLGAKRYLSAMKYCEFVLGNSSSGIVEAPAMKIPAINIGDRQKGRIIAKSIICCNPICKEIVSSMNMAISNSFKLIAQNVESPFGDGNTSERIFDEIVQFLQKRSVVLTKHFFDIDFDI